MPSLDSWRPQPMNWLREHTRAAVSAGISVHAAFMASGSIRAFPALAPHPAMGAMPLAVGPAIPLRHRRVVDRQQRARPFSPVRAHAAARSD